MDLSCSPNVKAGLSDILDDLGDLGRSVGVEVSGKFDDKDPNERSILFLDTPDYTLHENGLLLRQRVKRKSGKTEYTLKCRTEDRYIATGKDLTAVAGLKADSKFEEDIGVPFVSRFSHSTTVELDEDDDLAGRSFQRRCWRHATGSFLGVLAIRHDGLPCTPETTLAPVNSLQVFERVFKGPEVRFPKGRNRQESPTGSVRVDPLVEGRERPHLYSRILLPRYQDDNEDFSPEVASRRQALLSRDCSASTGWARPEASTKTQYLYGDRGR